MLLSVMLGKCSKKLLVRLVLNLMLFYSVCNSLQVSLLPQSLTVPKYPTVIKGIEIVQRQQEKQQLRGRRSRIKQFKGPFTIDKCFIEVSKRSYTDFHCETLDYKITRMRDFPGGAVVKISTCQCRGHRFDIYSRKIPHAAEQLSPCATATEPALQSPRSTTTEACALRARAPQQEKPP